MRTGPVLFLLGLLATPALGQSATERLPVCFACHGANGTSTTAKVPSLGAMPVNYVLAQLFLFREKIRKADPMNAMAEGLSDDDLRSIAASINALPAPKPDLALSEADRSAGQALVVLYRCNSCHGPGLEGQATVPHIAGQREEYVRQSLEEYKTNTRRGYSAAMNEVAQEIAEVDIPLLARFVARFSQP